MSLSRRSLIAAAAALVLGACRLSRSPVPTDWTEVDPLTVATEWDEHGLKEVYPLLVSDTASGKVTVVSEQSYDQFRLDEVDWARVEDSLARIRASSAHRRALTAAMGEWMTVWSGLSEIGLAEPIPAAEVAHTSLALGTPAVATVRLDQFRRLGDAVKAGGGFYLASRGVHHWVLAVKADSRLFPHPEVTVAANRLGVGLVPCAIRLTGVAVG